MRYRFEISLDVGNAIDSIGAIMERVNASLSKCGFNETIRLTVSIATVTMTCNRRLTPKELDMVRGCILRDFTEKVPNQKFFVALARCQSGNSRNQSRRATTTSK